MANNSMFAGKILEGVVFRLSKLIPTTEKMANLPRPNFKVGDLVLLRNPNFPRSKWDMGRIIQCHAGDDKLV